MIKDWIKSLLTLYCALTSYEDWSSSCFWIAVVYLDIVILTFNDWLRIAQSNVKVSYDDDDDDKIIE